MSQRYRSPVKHPTITIPTDESDPGFRNKLAGVFKGAAPIVRELVREGEEAQARIDALLGVKCDFSDEYNLKFWSWCRRHLGMEYAEMMHGWTLVELCHQIERAVEDGAPPLGPRESLKTVARSKTQIAEVIPGPAVKKKTGGRPVLDQTGYFVDAWKRLGSPLKLDKSICDQIADKVLPRAVWREARTNAADRKKIRDRIRSAIRRAIPATELVP